MQSILSSIAALAKQNELKKTKHDKPKLIKTKRTIPNIINQTYKTKVISQKIIKQTEQNKHKNRNKRK